MTRAEKTQLIEDLAVQLKESEYFYITDSSALSVENVNKLRRQFFENGIQMKVVKNTLMRKALESLPEEKNIGGLYDSLKGPTSILFTEVANAPAKILKEFRKTHEKPVLKAAYIDTDVFIGDDQIGPLSELKSKEDLLGDVIGLLQSPAKNVLSALQSGSQTLAGLVKALEERGADN
ncbi:50S ribosomal protein L10 [Membranicola marinus]|uniref:Large ribosomal subunit protein uL10 n=1 Tax=Membranihabitans marinus TaxID=1227546 RepID=A0A953HSL1_9BACT|nr:50S ribosomal protein L10 [Membranihabitans marinus]MBY5957620.1 50S ribosomal protein L10 [Membranihabitans marinus]